MQMALQETKQYKCQEIFDSTGLRSKNIIDYAKNENSAIGNIEVTPKRVAMKQFTQW